jgi:hypothetical protein
MSPLPQLVHDPQAFLRRQAGIGACVGLVGFIEATEDPDYLLHTFDCIVPEPPIRCRT